MSGNYGWGGRDRAADYDPPARDNTGFSRAYKPYDNGPSPDAFSKADANKSKAVPMSRAVGGKAASMAVHNVDLSAKKHIETAKKNVIILSMDRTGSMGDWRHEIFQRLALLFKESEKLLGESLEVIFTGFGDLAYGDTFEVAPPGSGPELDQYLLALDKHESGGGNMIESSEMPAYYVAHNVDTKSARNVFYFTITDEGFYPFIKESDVDATLGLRGGGEDSAKILRDLKVRANVFTILAQTGTCNSTVQRQWKGAIGEENVVELDDARRVVDVLLGIIAKLAGQFDQFSKALDARQLGTQYGKVNVKTVQDALSKVIGAPGTPSVKVGTKSLIVGVDPGLPAATAATPAPTPGGTKSLI